MLTAVTSVLHLNLPGASHESGPSPYDREEWRSQVLLLCSGPRVDVFVNFTLEPQPYKVGTIAMFQLRKSGLRYQADPAQGWKAGEWWSWDLKSMVSLYPCWSQLDLVCSSNVEGPFKGLLPQNSQQPCEVGAILQSYKLEILGPETSNIFPNTVQSGNKCHNQLSSETVRCHIFPGSQTPPGDQTFGDLGTPENT